MKQTGIYIELFLKQQNIYCHLGKYFNFCLLLISLFYLTLVILYSKFHFSDEKTGNPERLSDLSADTTPSDDEREQSLRFSSPSVWGAGAGPRAPLCDVGRLLELSPLLLGDVVRTEGWGNIKVHPGRDAAPRFPYSPLARSEPVGCHYSRRLLVLGLTLTLKKGHHYTEHARCSPGKYVQDTALILSWAVGKLANDTVPCHRHLSPTCHASQTIKSS